MNLDKCRKCWEGECMKCFSEKLGEIKVGRGKFLGVEMDNLRLGHEITPELLQRCEELGAFVSRREMHQKVLGLAQEAMSKLPESMRMNVVIVGGEE